MTMNASIMAYVGRPGAVATAVRIPVQGPFNTLVVVHLRNASLLPGIDWNNCKMMRYGISYPSTFILQGFDQRIPPDFRHSTTAFLSYVATGNDASFTYGLDEVSARFDEAGRYWIDYRTGMLNDCQVSAAACSLSSWLLVNEPPPVTHSAHSSSFSIDQGLALATRSGFALSPSGVKELLKAHECSCE